MKSITLIILAIASISSNLVYSWPLEWLFGYSAETINHLAEEYNNDVMKKTMTDYLYANQIAINQLKSRAAEEAYHPQSQKIDLHKKDPRDEINHEINRRKCIQKRINEDGLWVILNLKDEKKILTQKDLEDIKRIRNLNAKDFEKKLTEQYGSSNNLWYKIQKAHLNNIDEQEKKRAK